jgi:glucan biosynthesis protein C
MPEVDGPRLRIEGLDAWRALLMMLGVFLHAGLWTETPTMFAAIDLISGSFRMGAFFVISGLLSGLALTRRSGGPWLRDRLLTIGIPMAFGLGVVCPLIRLMLLHLPEADLPDPPLPYDWYHLWFLVALLLYAVVAWQIDRIDRRTKLFERISARFCEAAESPPPVVVATGTISFILIILTSMALVPLLPDAYHHSVVGQTRLILGYAPDYILGFAIARSPALRSTMLSQTATPVSILLATGLAYWWWFPELTSSEGASGFFLVLRMAGIAFCPPAAAVLILKSATAISRVPPAFRRLSEASFTIYILHLPIIALTALATLQMSSAPYLRYGLAVCASGLLSYSIHALLVRRSAFFGMLLNGRPATRLRSLPIQTDPCSAATN